MCSQETFRGTWEVSVVATGIIAELPIKQNKPKAESITRRPFKFAPYPEIVAWWVWPPAQF